MGGNSLGLWEAQSLSCGNAKERGRPQEQHSFLEGVTPRLPRNVRTSSHEVCKSPGGDRRRDLWGGDLVVIYTPFC
jgi:hypothetical protein